MNKSHALIFVLAIAMWCTTASTIYAQPNTGFDSDKSYFLEFPEMDPWPINHTWDIEPWPVQSINSREAGIDSFELDQIPYEKDVHDFDHSSDVKTFYDDADEKKDQQKHVNGECTHLLIECSDEDGDPPVGPGGGRFQPYIPPEGILCGRLLMHKDTAATLGLQCGFAYPIDSIINGFINQKNKRKACAENPSHPDRGTHKPYMPGTICHEGTHLWRYRNLKTPYNDQYACEEEKEAIIKQLECLQFERDCYGCPPGPPYSEEKQKNCEMMDKHKEWKEKLKAFHECVCLAIQPDKEIDSEECQACIEATVGTIPGVKDEDLCEVCKAYCRVFVKGKDNDEDYCKSCKKDCGQQGLQFFEFKRAASRGCEEGGGID
jgi:hypothetical protein